MNPPKSLMALGAAILLAAPCVARADDPAGEWLPLKTRPQSYFVHNVKPDSDEYAKMRKELFVGPVKLWVAEKQKDGTLQKVESGATLNCRYRKVQQAKKWVCAITANAKDGGSYEIAVDIGSKAVPVKAPAAQADAAAARPDGVSQEVWAEVTSGGKVPPANWARAAKDIEKALQSPKAAKMRAAGNLGLDQLVASVEKDIEGNVDDAKIVDRAIDLSEKLSSKIHPSAGAPPPVVAGADQGGNGVAGKPVKVSGDQVLNTLAALLAQPDVQADMAKRLYAYLTDPKGPTYVAADGHKDAALAQLQKGIAAGITQVNSEERGRSRAAVLYYMLGEDAAKPWFEGHADLAVMTHEQAARGYFAEAMKIWTDKGAGTPGVADAGPYKGDAKWPQALISSALDKAEETWKDKRVKHDLEISVGNFQQGVDVPGVFGQGGGGKINSGLMNLMARSFDAEAMYLNGAVHQKLLVPGSNPPAYREIALKIISKTTAWGPPQQVVDYLSIYDVSERYTDGRTPSNIVGQTFPLGQRGDLTFNLDDRTPGTVRYKLSMNGGNISFQPVSTHGKKPDEPVGEPLKTSISGLYDARNAELADSNQSYLATINGQNFRVVPQGGPKGMLVYFPADATGRAIGDTPALTSKLSMVDGGRTVGMKDKQPLGYIGKDASGKAQFWNLVWNDSFQAWEPQPGDPPAGPPEDAPKKDYPKKPADGGGNTANNGTTTTPPDNGSTGDNGDGDNAGNTDNTDTPTTDPSVKSTAVTACTYGKTFGTSSFEHYRTQDSWKLYTDATIDPSDNNKTYLCLYKQFGIWLDGLIPKDKRALGLIGGESDGYLHVIVVKPAGGGADASVRRITPGDAKNLELKGDEVAFGKDTTRDIDSAIEYYIPLKGLKANIKASKGSAVAAKVAWVEMHPDFLQGNVNPSMRVYLRPGDDVKAALTKALVDHAQDTVCADANGPTPQLKAYIDAVAKDDELKKELGKFDMANLNSTPPSVNFTCKAPLTAANGVWDVAQTSWWKSKNVLKTSGGKIDGASGYAKN